VGFIANLKGARSHVIVQQAVTSLGCMEHRGACSADDDSGDGAGIMTHIPWKIIKQAVPATDEATCGCVGRAGIESASLRARACLHSRRDAPCSPAR